jgi:hypothetical protein
MMPAIIACLELPVAARPEEPAQQCRNLQNRRDDMPVLVNHHTPQQHWIE